MTAGKAHSKCFYKIEKNTTESLEKDSVDLINHSHILTLFFI